MDFRTNLTKFCKLYPELKMQFTYYDWQTDFFRFYKSQTNYNISKHKSSLSATIHKGKHSYSFSLNDPTIEKLKEKVKETEAIIEKLPEDPDFIDIESDTTTADEKEIPNNIEKVSLDKKIAILTKIAQAVEPYDFKIYGSFICNYVTKYYINSNGINKSEVNSPIMLELKAVSEKNEVTVIESYGSENFSSFNEEEFIHNLTAKVKAAQNEIVDVEPGKYEVILAPRAIGMFWAFLSFGMHAKTLDAKMSFFENKENQKIFPENINLEDDPHNSDLVNFNYDSNGHIYNSLSLIENGVFKNFMVDNYYGRKLNKEINGAEGSALVMKTGKTNLADMIKSIDKGLFISNLHYMNFINFKETSVTGLTRDGTFLIENGKITKVVNNLRYTEKISDIINSITAIEANSYPIPSSSNYDTFSINSFKMPHVKVEDFKISSSTNKI